MADEVKRPDDASPEVVPDEPPVVARLVVEVRADGSRTVARGAMEDHATGVRVSVEAEGATPLELAKELARSMVRSPLRRARSLAKALLPGRRED